MGSLTETSFNQLAAGIKDKVAHRPSAGETASVEITSRELSSLLEWLGDSIIITLNPLLSQLNEIKRLKSHCIDTM